MMMKMMLLLVILPMGRRKGRGGGKTPGRNIPNILNQGVVTEAGLYQA